MIPLIITLLLLVGILGVMAYSLRQDRPLLDHVKSHWQQTIPHLDGSPTEFYEAVQALIREREMPDVNMQVVSWREGGILSDKRDYLRIRRGNVSFDLCVAPFGTGLFVSYWLCEHPTPLLEFAHSVPVVSRLTASLVRLFDPVTYYSVDAAGMFQGAVSACVLSVLDEMTTSQGLDPIPEGERKPIMRELYGRPSLAV